jgi:hypothetical protein
LARQRDPFSPGLARSETTTTRFARKPRDAFDVAVDRAALDVGREGEGLAIVDELPGRGRQRAEPQRRGLLGEHAQALAVDREAAEVLEPQRRRQADRVDVLPVVATLGEDLDPAAARAP